MPSRTAFVSRLVGLYTILVSLALVSHKEASVATVSTLIQTPALLLLLGMITLGAGLAIVLGHNVWSGGALPVIVTLVGWATLIKGLLFVVLSPETLVALLRALHYADLYYLYLGISILLGVYLTYNGFTSRR
jgi:vacuolar-type H+-ATPase subunit I/STV1